MKTLLNDRSYSLHIMRIFSEIEKIEIDLFQDGFSLTSLSFLVAALALAAPPPEGSSPAARGRPAPNFREEREKGRRMRG